MSKESVNAWRCTICGYIHRGPAPPDVCPVCGAKADAFEAAPDAPPAEASAWRCKVCGYVHRGPAPPSPCPVCGASAEAFEPYQDATTAVDAPPTNQWRCLNCSYVHFGTEPPGECPVCGAHADRFGPHQDEAARPSTTGAGPRVIVVGAGVAGVSAAEAVRQSSPGAQITLVSKDEGLPLYRLNLTRALAGEVGDEALLLHPEAWYGEQNIDLRQGAEVAALGLGDGQVRLRSGEELDYDKLILTAGSHPFVPPFMGAHREGVTPFRSLEDYERILEAVSAGSRAVIIGGGILGLETAGALAARGLDVEVLEGFSWLLPRQLNERAAKILETHVRGVGIEVRTTARTKELVGDERVRGVLLDDGTTIPGELVVVSTGVRSNSYLARLAGLDVAAGVVVDDNLRTSHPDVFAAGDVAEHRGTVYGLWMPSMFQGSIAGMNAAGVDAEFGGIPRSNTLKVLDFDLFSIGVVEPEDGSYEVMDEERDGTYTRFVFRDCTMVGAILVGDTTLSATVKSAVEDRRDFSGVVGTRGGCKDVLDVLAEGK